jgi:hypothetical protein
VGKTGGGDSSSASFGGFASSVLYVCNLLARILR